MSNWLKNLFTVIFGANSEIATFIISMIPIVELRGAIPFGAATSFWGENALPLWESFLISLAGSSLICILLAFVFQPLFKWLKSTKAFRRFADWIERKLKRNSKNIDKRASGQSSERRVAWLKMAGVFLFVAVPLPLTGVWTGTCVALFIGLNRKQTIGSVLTGNLVAGSIMLLISYFFADNTMVVFYAFLILVAAFILIELIRKLVLKIISKRQASKSDGNAEGSNAEDSNEKENEASESRSGEVEAEVSITTGMPTLEEVKEEKVDREEK